MPCMPRTGAITRDTDATGLALGRAALASDRQAVACDVPSTAGAFASSASPNPNPARPPSTAAPKAFGRVRRAGVGGARPARGGPVRAGRRLAVMVKAMQRKVRCLMVRARTPACPRLKAPKPGVWRRPAARPGKRPIQLPGRSADEQFRERHGAPPFLTPARFTTHPGQRERVRDPLPGPNAARATAALAVFACVRPARPRPDRVAQRVTSPGPNAGRRDG